MRVLRKPIEAVSEIDLKSLVEDQVCERKTLEFKSILPGRTDADKKEFLADVASFANAAGGEIAYGISEREGIAVGIPGLSGVDLDQETLRIENMIRDGVAPRISGLAIHRVPLDGGGAVLILQVPQSWAAPHMVAFGGSSKFYSRTSAGKYALDVHEIRAAFTASDTGVTRVREFRADRVSRLISNQTDFSLAAGGKTVLHLVPFAAYDPRSTYDLDSQLTDRSAIAPIYSRYPPEVRYNFDGLLTFEEGRPPGTVAKYLQLFRNGTIETVDCLMLGHPSESRAIPSLTLQLELIKALARYLELYSRMGVSPPVWMMLSLLNVKGLKMALDSFVYLNDAKEIDRDHLLVREILVEDFSIPPERILRPVFDTVWNASGLQRSPDYNESGEWSPRRS